MELVVLAIGTVRERWILEGLAEYERRIRRYLPFRMVEAKDGAQALRRVGVEDTVIVLDAGGEEPTSEQLASWLGRALAKGGRGALVFALGGAEGLPPALRARAARALSLSRLTLPHRVARLILLEQLYRALSILRGDPYHK